MIPYIFIFVISAVIALLHFNTKGKDYPLVFGIYVVALGTFVGISDMLGGYDRYIYCEVYSGVSERIANGEGVLNEMFMMYLAKEPVYGMINVLIGMYTPNRYIFILIYTLLIYVVYGVCFYRYTEKPFFALLVFLGLMFFFTFTYLRQVLAAGIVWLALPYYTKRKIWQYMVMIAIATMTHNSAIIMVVLYFLPLQKWQFEKIMIVMLILFIMGLNGLADMYFFAGSLTGVENITKHADAAETGFRYEYVVESLLFLYILYLNYRSVNRTDKETLSYLNLYLMFCGILLLFCKSGDGGRIAWYGIMGIIIMLTRFCMGRKNGLLKPFLVVMFFALYMRIVLAWDVLLSPYKTFFTDGIREGDWIYDRYEYDKNYEHDKFYNL